MRGHAWKMTEKDKKLDSLDSRSSTLGSQANHSEKKVIGIAAKSIPNNIIDIQDNNIICEANGCYRQATNEIKLDVGQFGKLSLFLCRNCVPKFKVSEE